MKKSLLFLFVWICALSSCSKSGHGDEQDFVDLSASNGSYSVSLADIKTYVTKYKGISETKVSEVSITPIIADVDTLMYLVNYSDGWDLLSADRRAPLHFAMSDKGHLFSTDFSDCPELDALYNSFISNIAYLKQNPEKKAELAIQDRWDDVLPERTLDWELVSTTILSESDLVQNHLTQTRWGQGNPWNVKAPYKDSTLSSHCYTGCVPVAASQVLFYLHQQIGIPDKAYQESYTSAYIPSNSDCLILQSTDVQLDTSSYASSTWDAMPLSITSSNSYSGVSTLMLQTGLYLGANYMRNGTSAYTSSIRTVFDNSFSISSTGTSNVDFDIISQQIFHEHLPVILSISRWSNNVRYGHAVIVDACKEHYQRVRRFYRRQVPTMFPEQGPMYEFKAETSVEMVARYVGINWGWDGSYMLSGGDTIWFGTDAISWNVGYVYTSLDYMIYGFHTE